jgi:hypothetical protein
MGRSHGYAPTQDVGLLFYDLYSLELDPPLLNILLLLLHSSIKALQSSFITLYIHSQFETGITYALLSQI